MSKKYLAIGVVLSMVSCFLMGVYMADSKYGGVLCSLVSFMCSVWIICDHNAH